MNSAKVPYSKEPSLSGERFSIVYRLSGSADEARLKAEDITVEQTVEFPSTLVPEGVIKSDILGRIESFKSKDGAFEASISFAVETSGDELTQLLNVVFGNISLKLGIRVQRIDLPQAVLKCFKGPRYGPKGLRELLGVKERPLLSTALKPQGLCPEDLAELAFQLASGGIDIIKDDHGLANQHFARFEERAAKASEAVQRANAQTGFHSIYAPNITADTREFFLRARLAKALGAGAVVISPGLTGLDAMRTLAEDDSFSLPIITHPAFQGSFVIHPDSGISPYALFGQISRLAGADGSIFPNYGGRFSFSKEDCQQIARGCSDDFGGLRPIFPFPGGGMSLDRVSEMVAFYQKDVVFLIGGGLFQYGPDLIQNCQRFKEMVSEF